MREGNLGETGDGDVAVGAEVVDEHRQLLLRREEEAGVGAQALQLQHTRALSRVNWALSDRTTGRLEVELELITS